MRVGQAGVGEFVAGAAAFRHHDHQAAAAQAREMVGQVLPATPSRSAKSAGYAGPSRNASSSRERVGSESA